MEVSRKMKPEIPLIGDNSIPLRHEIEFEMVLKWVVERFLFFQDDIYCEIEKIIVAENLVDSRIYLLIQSVLLEEAKKRGFI